MKKSLFSLCLLALVFLVACKKDNATASTSGNAGEIRYEFTADVPAAYRISTLTGSLNYDETFPGQASPKQLHRRQDPVTEIWRA